RRKVVGTTDQQGETCLSTEMEDVEFVHGDDVSLHFGYLVAALVRIHSIRVSRAEGQTRRSRFSLTGLDIDVIAAAEQLQYSRRTSGQTTSMVWRRERAEEEDGSVISTETTMCVVDRRTILTPFSFLHSCLLIDRMSALRKSQLIAREAMLTHLYGTH
ncbi:hypothetical protein PENTCL1PPCAC_23987, partial [Pristionchus entomophagus]